jgi:hypothetical protein
VDRLVVGRCVEGDDDFSVVEFIRRSFDVTNDTSIDDILVI